MKALILATTAVVGFAAPSLAGGPTLIADDPIIAAAPAPVAAVHDWSGPYVGLSYGQSRGSQATDVTNGPVYDFSSGKVPGIHLGYLMHHNNFVYGGELSYLRYNDVIMAGLPAYHMDSSLDLKGRVGLATNRVLFYGILGYSMAKFPVDTLAVEYKPKGPSYGLGVDYAATERLTVGLEYLSRKMDADSPNGATSEIEVNLNTVSLRVGFSF